MRLGLNLGYWGFGNDADNLVLAQEADRLGYAVAWVAEAYGSDGPTVLAWVGAQTSRIDLGAAVFQIPARTPAMTAMTAATLDSLSGGRFRLGLGVSGPQVSEGWHGVPFAKPLGRTREYVEIVRQALRRERLEYAGEHWTLPLPGGPGKPIKLTVHPVRERIPIYLASVGPKNLELTGEIADGWLAIFFAPEHAEISLAPLRAGAARAERDLNGFDIVPTVPVAIGQDLDELAGPIRAYAALYVGGMGSREQNFYHALACRMGFEEEAGRVQDLYLAKKYVEAAAAVPRDFIDSTSLIGPPERIRDRMHAYAEAGVTTLTVTPFATTLEGRLSIVRQMAEILDASGLASGDALSGILGYGDAAVLGVVEGLTEFLPVSSTGHLTVFEGLLGLPVDDKAVTAFTVIIQFGAIVATFLYFRTDIARLFMAWLRGLMDSGERQNPDYRFAWFVIAGSIPIAVIGLALHSVIEGPLRNLWVVAAALISWSAVMWWAERHPAQKLDEEALSLRQVLIVGFVQCLALIPGVSRSGATISTGLLLGANRVAATRLSFFLAIPSLTGAGLYQLKDVDTKVVGWGELGVGTLVAFVVAYASIAWLLQLVAKYPITFFVPYRIAAGIAVIILVASGVVAAAG